MKHIHLEANCPKCKTSLSVVGSFTKCFSREVTAELLKGVEVRCKECESIFTFKSELILKPKKECKDAN